MAAIQVDFKHVLQTQWVLTELALTKNRAKWESVNYVTAFCTSPARILNGDWHMSNMFSDMKNADCLG